MSIMKYRTIVTKDETTVILEDGGIAVIRDIEESSMGDGRQSTTDYYQDRFTEETLNDDLWETLGEGEMHYNDWQTPHDDPAHLKDALEWLSVGTTFEKDNSIWPNFEEATQTNIIPPMNETPTEQETTQPMKP